MGEKLSILIKQYKSGDDTKFIAILDKLEPLINKYVRLLYKDEKEDMHSEFVLYLLECLIKMEYYDEEGQCISYFSRALKHKFYELYKISRKHFDSEVDINDEYIKDIQLKNNDYEECILHEDLNNFLFYNNKEKNYKIIYDMIFNDATDIQIAQKFNISRQYANRLRKKFYSLLKENYFPYTY